MRQEKDPQNGISEMQNISDKDITTLAIIYQIINLVTRAERVIYAPLDWLMARLAKLGREQ